MKGIVCGAFSNPFKQIGKQKLNFFHHTPSFATKDKGSFWTLFSYSTEGDKEEEDVVCLRPIGYVNSIYRLCVGTPRQGLLAPNSRGRIDLLPNMLAEDAIFDLDQFSHLWIVFHFHLNTKQTTKQQKQLTSKISPPALGGKKVGIFATRSPHRPNPIGFTLCKLDKISKHSIYISGIDLVDGTPVMDIKPYVPTYDSPLFLEQKVSVPTWIEDGLEKRRPVKFSLDSEKQLQSIMVDQEKYNDIDFYGNDDESYQEALDNITQCIVQVLSVDVRSAWQTGKARKGKFQAEKSSRLRETSMNVGKDITPEEEGEGKGKEVFCTQQIDNLLIKYTVKRRDDLDEIDASTNSDNINTHGSGADDLVFIHEINLIPKKRRRKKNT